MMTKPIFTELNEDNIANEHLCCIIRKTKPHPGVEVKRTWLKKRLAEGHVFRKLDTDACVFIEYSPLEKAWVPAEGSNYLYIYCLWVNGAPKGHGYGKQLMESCISEAKAKGKSGVCMLGAKNEKAWLSDQSFAQKYGFEAADTAGEYELLALSFDGTLPRFSASAKTLTIENREFTVYYDDQCPYIRQRVEKLKKCAAENGLSARFIHVDTLEKAKTLPCPFNNWAVFFNGKLVTVNQIDEKTMMKITKEQK